MPGDLQVTPFEGAKPYLLIDGLLTGNPLGYTAQIDLPECVESDTVLVADGSRSGLALRGRCGVLGSTLLIYRALPNVDDGFLYYLIESLYEFLNKAPTGAAIPHLDQGLLARLKVAVPSTREEQTRIGDVLKAADDHIRALEAQLRKAERVKTALLQSIFIEGIPGGAKTSQDFRWGMAPDGWVETTIRSIITEPVGNGTSPDAARQEPPGFPTLNVSSIRNGRCDQTEISYIELPDKAAVAFAVEQGDFFVLRGNGNRDFIAIGGLLGEEPRPGLVFSDLLIRLRFDKSKALPEFMKYFWQSPPFLRRIQSYAVTGSGLWKIGQRSISHLKLAVPPDTSEQKEIAAIFDAQEDLLLSLGSQLTAARRVKQSLLQNLLTGKIRLRA